MPSVMIEKMITATGLRTFPTGPHPELRCRRRRRRGAGVGIGHE